MHTHSLQGDTDFGRWHCLCVLREAVQQDAGSAFIKETKNSVARLAQPQAKLPQLALNLRGIWKIERGPVFPKHLNPGEKFGAHFLGLVEHPIPSRQSFFVSLEEIDAPAGRVFRYHIGILS
jgi:hypothetical protein